MSIPHEQHVYVAGCGPLSVAGSYSNVLNFANITSETYYLLLHQYNTCELSLNAWMNKEFSSKFSIKFKQLLSLFDILLQRIKIHYMLLIDVEQIVYLLRFIC